MAHEAGIAPASPRLQRGANLSQLLVAWLAEPKLGERRLVVRRGNAPRSSAYQADALLLSYRTKIERWLAEPKLGERRMVVLRGNAPRSSAYQAGALLLSYETSSNCGFEPNCRIGRKVALGFAAGRMRMRRFGL